MYDYSEAGDRIGPLRDEGHFEGQEHAEDLLKTPGHKLLVG